MKDTFALHLTIGFSVAAFSWVFFALPLIHWGLIASMITLFFWAGILPLIMTSSGAIYRTISGNDYFVVIKLWSVAVALVICQFLVYRAFITGKRSNITLIMVILLVINMLEAIVTQFLQYREKGSTIDLFNSIVGLFLTIGVIKEYYGKNSERMTTKGLRLQSKLSWTFIWGYAFWNLLFRSRLLPNTSTFLFLVPSILMPMITHFWGVGDWFQVRLLGLLMVLIFQLGITPGEGTIFSTYNTQGYNKTVDEQNPISEIQRENWYENGLLLFGSLSSAFLLTQDILD